MEGLAGRKGGGNAFPQTFSKEGSVSGMNMRQWYKGMAIAGAMYTSLQAAKLGYPGLSPKSEEDIARVCSEIADAMLAEDEKFNHE